MASFTLRTKPLPIWNWWRPQREFSRLALFAGMPLPGYRYDARLVYAPGGTLHAGIPRHPRKNGHVGRDPHTRDRRSNHAPAGEYVCPRRRDLVFGHTDAVDRTGNR